jgi:hypothetical protein
VMETMLRAVRFRKEDWAVIFCIEGRD